MLSAQLDPQQFQVSSAGLDAEPGRPVDGMAGMELERLGHSPEGFSSTAVTGYLIESADLVLVATRKHRSAILQADPSALHKTFTFLEFADLASRADAHSLDTVVHAAAQSRMNGPEDPDIDDPYRLEPKIHRHVAEQIAHASERISAVLTSIAAD